MFNLLRHILRTKSNVITHNANYQFIFNAKRNLITSISLGIDDYLVERAKYNGIYQIEAEQFINKMKNVASDEGSIIYSNDFKKILYLVSNNPEQIEIVKKLLIKYENQNETLRFSTFKFGPVIMRTLHHLNLPDVAKELFLTAASKNTFDQISSYMLIMDLLYENEKYDDLIEVYDIIRTKFLYNVQHPGSIATIVAVTCYLQNTPKSLEYVQEICADICKKSTFPNRKIISLTAALAIKQKKPQVALEVLSACMQMNYVSVRSLQIIATAEMDNIVDIMAQLQAILNNPHKIYLYPDVVEKVKEAVERTGLHEKEVLDLLNEFEKLSLIYSLTLHEHLLSEISFSRTKAPKYRDEKWVQGFGVNDESSTRSRHKLKYDRKLHTLYQPS